MKTETGIEFKDGIIYEGENKVGTIQQDLRYGYHPCVKLQVNGESMWCELDLGMEEWAKRVKHLLLKKSDKN